MKDLLPLFRDIEFGDNQLLVMAGPCSAESREQVLQTARALASIGIRIFRAGVWKPRTKPGGFEGVGAPALQWLAEAKALTGMLMATEVANAQHASQAIDSGIDIIWIGARTSANPFAVQEIADMLATLPPERREQLTVLVKNPVNPDLELWIGALERIYGAGVRRLGAIHRGFSSYGKHIYRNPPKWAIPIELHRRLPNLPIICDPSHIGGKRELIGPLSQQALEMKFSGLIIESHCHPELALSDAAQQVTPSELAEILDSLIVPRGSAEFDGEMGRPATENLELLRAKIDRIDDELLELLAKRMAVAREIGRYKQQKRMSVLQPGRYNDLMERRLELAAPLELSNDFVRSILALIHEESVRQQLSLPSSTDFSGD